ncbi:GntR family transcriptional regulator [Marinovum sp.]|uniref:GntR family transcriptional regulator n=1 Tax=Marinovum sp. TaxID=2024839 RepID=UPI002B26669E|nr:GntR family transcriptional regulator [Marinovum sp.]
MATPLYQTVIDTIVARIAGGELPSGAMLPSETQLGVELGVSQGTARKALIELEKRGLVQRAQGRGTFVTVRTPETSLFSFFRLRRADGSLDMPQLESESLRRRAATERETGLLHGRPAEVIEIERVRSISGRAVAHEVSVIGAPMFPGLAERSPLPNTLYVFFQQAYSVIIVQADERLRAISAPQASARALGIAEGSPVLEVRRQAVDVLDRIVELRRSITLTQDQDYLISLS